MLHLLKFQKVRAWWVPRELKDREKMNRMGLSLQRLLRYADKGEDMLNRIVMEDESWVCYYQPKSNHASVRQKHLSSPSTKKFEFTPSIGKFMLTVFWDSQGVLLAHFQKHGENVNFSSYSKVLLNHRDAICRNLQANW
jgi:hypothetical protein